MSDLSRNAINSLQASIHYAGLTNQKTEDDWLPAICKDIEPCVGCFFKVICVDGFECRNFVLWQRTGRNPNLTEKADRYPQKMKNL